MLRCPPVEGRQSGGLRTGYVTKVQVIERRNRTRQFYMILPAPLAEALEAQKA